jgi:CRISPR type I-E-associated protein CasB/Cse2
MTTSTSLIHQAPIDHLAEFVASLRRLDRRALAHLRLSLSDPALVPTHAAPYVYPRLVPDEPALQRRIAGKLDAGAIEVWAVRRVGPGGRRVDVYAMGKPVRTVDREETLPVPGTDAVVPAAALFDRRQRPPALRMAGNALAVEYADVSRTSRRAHVLLAGLFATYPDAPPGGSLGNAFRAMMGVRESSESLRQRFAALLDSELEDLAHPLFTTLTLLRSRRQPLDWERLLRDLLGWDHPDRYVQERLARDCWQFSTLTTPEGDSAP